jgi:tripeptidyl-peptidase-1
LHLQGLARRWTILKMKAGLLSAAVAAFITLGTALPKTSRSALHEKRESIPRLWSRGYPVDADAVLPIRIGLTQTNLEDGVKHLMDM